MVGCNQIKTVNIEFPFEMEDITNIEMYHYSGAPVSAEKKVVVAEQNMGQFAGYLRMKIDGFVPYQYNEVKGQPFVVTELAEAFTEILNK